LLPKCQPYGLFALVEGTRTTTKALFPARFCIFAYPEFVFLSGTVQSAREMVCDYPPLKRTVPDRNTTEHFLFPADK
jgi:hypothetical protein